MINVERLKIILSYDQETGIFIWRVKTSSRACVGYVAGHLTNCGYRSIKIDGRHILAHRLAWLYMTGEWPTDDIDHINLDRTDNRWINLRSATRSQNKANAAAPVCNTSGFKGASWHKSTKKWRATIKVAGKPQHLGSFSSAEEAHTAYCGAAKKSFGNFARNK